MRAHFWFDLETYRSLDAASRRLFLILKKVFHRSSESPRWDLTHLAVDVLGYSPLERKFLKRKVKTCADRLAALGIINPSRELFERHEKSLYVQFHRGVYFDKEQKTPRVAPIEELPIYEQWLSIGVDLEGMQYLRRNFSMETLEQWADITLLAKERHGAKFFERSMAAYYIDNVKAAKKVGRRPPDWWHEFKKKELYSVPDLEEGFHENGVDQPERREYVAWLKSDGRNLHEKTLHELLESVQVNGRLSEGQAANARQIADTILWNEFLVQARTSNLKNS
jgi:hypothetical protein